MSRVTHGPTAADGAPGEPAHEGDPAASALDHLKADSLCRAVIESLVEAVFVQEPDGRIIAWNAAATRIFGIDAETALSQPHGVALMPGWRAMREDGTPLPPDELPSRRALTTGQPQRDVVIGFARDDETRWIEGSATPLVEAGETRPYAVVSTCADITQRREAEERIARLTAMRDVAESVAHVGSVSLDLATQRSTWSPEVYHLFDLPPETEPDFLTFLRSRVHPDDQQRLRDVYARLAAGGEPESIEHRVVWRDGSLHVLHQAGTLETDESGAPLRATGYVRDVTEQVAATEELTRLKELRDLAESVGHASGVRVDLKTGEQLWPPEVYRLMDIDPDTDLARRPVLVNERTHPEDRGLVSDPLEEIAQTGRTRTLDFRVRWRDGSEHILHREGIVEFDEAGCPAAIVGYMQDVTEQRQAEDEIRRLNAELARRVELTTEQRDALNRELEAFAYSIAHDVRTPLRAIDGFSASVLEDESDSLSEDGAAALKRVRLAAQRLARLLDELTGLSRVSRRDLARRTVDVSALALGVGEELAAEQPSRALDFVVEPGLTTSADPGMLRLVLRELLGNAWKFTRGRERARVEVGVADVAGEPAFFVRDDGAGFEMRHATHLFGAFQRMHTSDEFEGSGVGLATVQRVVARHGGRVWAEAAVGEGATFFFTLPEQDD